MNSSSSSVTSTSVTDGEETQLLHSLSSPPPHPPLSLQSPELHAELLREWQDKFRPHSDVSDSSVVSPSSSPLTSPFSPTSSPWSSSSSSPSPSYNNRSARLSLSSPELLSELKQSRTRSLRRVPAHNGLTTVFSGRGRRGGGRGGEASASASSTANQKTSH